MHSMLLLFLPRFQQMSSCTALLHMYPVARSHPLEPSLQLQVPIHPGAVMQMHKLPRTQHTALYCSSARAAARCAAHMNRYRC
jgi:hypothetical protein